MMQLNNYSLKSVAIYCRLSREDEDSRESSSIQSQKEMLTDYARQQNWRIYDYYIDDGYTGTNFNRPAFKRMISDIENKNVNIVITKDLSRLGRNYLDTGRYTEEFFPMHNVRYIAINDNYDSAEGDNDLAPFKNIINEWYAKDISKKVKSVVQLKYNKGEVFSASIPLYGYKFKEGTFEREIEPETAEVVRKIFEMYLDGISTKLMIQYLKENKIYCPGYYYYLNYNNRTEIYSKFSEEESYTWSPSMINRIINNRYEYLGHLILGKTKKISFKLKKRNFSKENTDRKYIENRYEPIISQETYDRVESIVSHRSVSSLPLDENPYRELLTCSCCGRRLRLKRFKNKEGYTYYYICRNDNCDSNVLIKRDSMTVILREHIKMLFKQIVIEEDKFLEFVSDYIVLLKQKKKVNKQSSVDIEVKSCHERLEKVNKLIEKLFESNINGQVPVQLYEKMMKKYKEEADSLNAKIKELVQMIPKANDNIDYLELAKEFIDRLRLVNFKHFNRSDILSLIKDIKVTRKDNKEYDIHILYYKIPTIIEAYLNEQVL